MLLQNRRELKYVLSDQIIAVVALGVYKARSLHAIAETPLLSFNVRLPQSIDNTDDAPGGNGGAAPYICLFKESMLVFPLMSCTNTLPVISSEPEMIADPVICTCEPEAKIRFDLAPSDVPLPTINADWADDDKLY
jgi:hypothetical protein